MKLKYAVSGIFILIIASTSGCVQNEKQIPAAVDGIRLNKYMDNVSYFSLSKPDNWSVSARDYILVEDKTDNGITNVRIQPIHLSGKYRHITARDIANYLVGKKKQNYQKFELNSVRESGDTKVLELVATFTENRVNKKGVFSVFVNNPYAMLSSYETSVDKFAEKEKLLSTIALSYRQLTPPDTSQLKSKIGSLQETNQQGVVKMRLPDGWNVQVFPGCAGLIAQDKSNHARTVIFLNGLHQSVEPLSPGITPEDYVTDIMPNDFKTISNVKIIKYEDADLSALTGGGKIAVKAMRISFTNEGIPATGSFTVGTYQTGISTAVAYLWGISSPANEFNADAPVLLEMFYSIDYSSSKIEQWRAALSASWEGARKLQETIAKTGEEIRQENLQLYEQRQEKNDEFLEKFSDAILNRERVYNPKYDEVYEVSDTFYEYYDTHREKFEYQDMRQLEAGEWLKYTPLNGELHIQ